MAVKEYSTFPKATALLEPHHQIVECHIQDTHWEGGLTSLQRSSKCILQPQPTEQQSYLMHRCDPHRYYHFTMKLGVMAMTPHSSVVLELEPHHWIQFSIVHWTQKLGSVKNGCVKLEMLDNYMVTELPILFMKWSKSIPTETLYFFIFKGRHVHS